MVAIPHEFFKRVVREACGVRLPAAEQYAVMMAFLPKEPEQYHQAKGIVAKCAPRAAHGCAVRAVLSLRSLALSGLLSGCAGKFQGIGAVA